MNYITRFLKGNWLDRAKLYAFNPQKMKVLIVQLGWYLTKNGLKDAKGALLLISSYLYDIATGIYKGYDAKKLLIVIAAVIYVVTPLDFLPDFIPPGLIDDFSIIAWAMSEAASELDRYRKSKNKPPTENV